jgi:hypothetical protein
MKIITKKESSRFASFLLIAGIGALLLTVAWTVDNDVVSSLPVLFYYIFNSLLLILLGITLRAERFKIYSTLAILLGISVTASLFIPMDGEGSLFLETVFRGMFLGAVFGGIILVPMFLAGVYISAVRGIQYFGGGLDYAAFETTINDKANTSLPGNAPADLSSSKPIVHKIIPIIGFIAALLQVYSWRHVSWGSLPEIIFLPDLFLPLVVLPIFSLINKNANVYFIANIIIAVASTAFFFIGPGLMGPVSYSPFDILSRYLTHPNPLLDF